MSRRGPKPDADSRPRQSRRRSPLPSIGLPTEPEPLGALDALDPAYDPNLGPIVPPAGNQAASVAISEALAEPDVPLEPLPSPLQLLGKAGRGRRSVSEKTVRQIMGLKVLERMLDDPLYLQTIEKRMREGKLAPQLETFFWQRVHGRPLEALPSDRDGTGSVKIINEFTAVIEKPVEGDT